MASNDGSFFHAGSRTGFLLAHGFSGSPLQLRYVTNGLVRAGFTVSAPQLIGHNGSFDDLKYSTWKDWYRGVEEAFFELKKSCDIIIAGGFSMGSVLALKLAADHPDDVHGLTLFAPVFNYDGWSVPKAVRLFSVVCDNWTADRFQFREREPYGIKNARLREFVMNAINTEDGAKPSLPVIPGRSLMQFRFMAKTVKRELRNIRQPTLVCHPRHDDRGSLTNVELLQRQLAGRVTTVVLDDCYHVVTLDQQRDIVLEAALDFGFKLEARLGGSMTSHPAAGRPAAAVLKSA